jgi:hypothetical protein
MKRVSLDSANEHIKDIFRSLPFDGKGCILELDGKPLLKILPVTEVAVDKARLRAAILKRREESRKINEEWEAVDREAWPPQSSRDQQGPSAQMP